MLPIRCLAPSLAQLPPAKSWHRAAVLNNSAFVPAAEHARVRAGAPRPLGCGTRSPFPPRCSGALAAPPWRRRFQSLPAQRGRERE